ncbi:MAG: hypothetical protein IIB00_08795, partial [candidate division Zixibacteria bacterium]|nr:hypothetical protein [candidate division Zixibacteria bacterium]
FYAVPIPFSWAGSSGIFLDSASTAGTRIEHFAQSGLIVVDPFTLRAVFSATSFLQGADSLVGPDSGLILSLYFSVSPTSSPVDVPIVGFGGYSPLFFAEAASYSPVGVAGSVAPIIFTCGDANGSGAVDVGDAIFLIRYIFSDEAPPVPLESGDADGSGDVNVGDATYLIKYIFSDGPDPQCF